MFEGIPFSEVRNYGLKKYNMDITFKIFEKVSKFSLVFHEGF
jgi:hypothetical protein